MMKGKWKLEFSTEERYKASCCTRVRTPLFSCEPPWRSPGRTEINEGGGRYYLWYCCAVVPACLRVHHSLITANEFMMLEGWLQFPNHYCKRFHDVSRNNVCTQSWALEEDVGEEKEKNKKKLGMSSRNVVSVLLTIRPLRGVLAFHPHKTSKINQKLAKSKSTFDNLCF